MAEGNLFRRMFDALLAEGALQLAAYAAPPVLTAAVAYLGISENLPWAYVLTATVVVFAAAATGLLRFSEWRQRISARNKVTLEWVNFSYDGDKGDLGHLQNLKAVQFLISLKNDAVFPLSYVVERLDIAVENKIPRDRLFRNTPFELPPNSSRWFRDGTIDLGGITPISLTGHAEIRIKYGRPGHEKYEIIERYNLYLPFDSTFGMYQALQTTFDLQPQGAER